MNPNTSDHLQGNSGFSHNTLSVHGGYNLLMVWDIKLLAMDLYMKLCQVNTA